MKRNLFVLLLIILIVAVSCTPESNPNDTIKVRFGFGEKLQAKTPEVYDVTTTSPTSSVVIGSVNDYYWAYKATKTDSLFTEGQTSGFVNCADGTGLGGDKIFSRGDWKFELKAYKTAKERTAGTTAVFSGETAESLSKNTSIRVPVIYTYASGTGIVNFSIEVSSSLSLKIEITIDGSTITLTGDKTCTGTATVSTGVKTVGIKAYNGTEEVYSNDNWGTVIVVHGLESNVNGAIT